jgi:SAM-dependent methyltransferase
MRLHLGCGNDKRRGWVNCDVSPQVDPDRIVDLEEGLPFGDDSVDEILANHVFEHVRNFVPLMHEVYRVCKNGARIKVRVPFYAAWGWFNDPTHVRFFSPFTFDYFKKGTYSHEVGCDHDMFDVRRVRLNFGIGRAKKLNWIVNPIINFHQAFYCRFFAWILPATEIEYDLVVLK